MNLSIYVAILSSIVLGRRANVQICDKQAAMENSLRLAADFVDNFNSGELGQIFKRLMKPGATLTGTSAHPDCVQTTTNMRTTLIEQYQLGLRVESITKSAFFSAKDSTVVVSVAHMTGPMGVNPGLVDVKLYLSPDEECNYKIQSMSQTPYGCLKSSM